MEIPACLLWQICNTITGALLAHEKICILESLRQAATNVQSNLIVYESFNRPYRVKIFSHKNVVTAEINPNHLNFQRKNEFFHWELSASWTTQEYQRRS